MNTRMSLSSPVGPYEPLITYGDLIFLSGQVPRDPATGDVVQGSICEQTTSMFENVKALLESAQLDFDNVIKTTVYLTDMRDFAEMNAAYATFFTPPYPARTTVAVAELPLGASMEIDVVAGRKGRSK